MVPETVAAALGRAATAPTLLVATDFDGVLAPLVLDPSQSRALPGTLEDLESLASLPSTHAAVVSGRDLSTLTQLTGLADSAVTRIGSHGAESSADTSSNDLDGSRADALAALVDDVATVAAEHPGSGVEHKPAAVVLHTRGMEAGPARAAEDAAIKVAARHTEAHVMHGKHVVEMSVVRADKGTALMALRDAVSADAVVYFGDDVTDEDVFRLLSEADVGVKVGDGPTAAAYRVDTPEDVADALSMLVARRNPTA
ncbi:trehalose-phosphatase [Nostocoides sp. HKS02]|uniref:trehalose-phosphatase n=1 Tax=Nostocoides sp. HKS02 TaxID=1813880 RepID=UPI0012B49579|nr:trehalose-phosphatase [Tetrasphaera sp. HKS02]QGN58960.1 trehalose-phosphatase [Tetrasphaera sp. HKS02]